MTNHDAAAKGCKRAGLSGEDGKGGGKGMEHEHV